MSFFLEKSFHRFIKTQIYKRLSNKQHGGESCDLGSTTSNMSTLNVLWMRSGSYLALQTVRGVADNANKHNQDITNGSVLRHNCTLSTLFLPR